MKHHPSEEYEALRENLTRVLSERTEAATADRLRLRDAVCAYAEVEHLRGTALADVIQAVKDILASAEQAGVKPSQELARELVDWCVEFHRNARRIPLA